MLKYKYYWALKARKEEKNENCLRLVQEANGRKSAQGRPESKPLYLQRVFAERDGKVKKICWSIGGQMTSVLFTRGIAALLLFWYSRV